jgi:hypothetical protein
VKIKDNCTASTSDFWYDLAYGGYLKPEEMLESPSDAYRVREAIETLAEFEMACEQQIEGFAQ